MNITCDQCGKRYKMKAEQTKKAFKTRCKRCSNVIIVRPEDHQSSTATAGVQPAAESAQAQWYAVVNGQQSGPFTEAQVSEYLVAGSLDAQSFVWCEGMSNWEAISSVPQLNALLPRAATPAPVTSAPVPNSMSSSVSADDSMSTSQSSPKPEQQSAPQPALSMGVQIGHNRDLLAQVASQTPETAQVFASSESSASAQVMFDAPESQSGAQLSNQRNENSVLFSLDSIDSMGSQGVQVQNQPSNKNNSPATLGSPIVTNTGGSEGSGLIDLAALSSLTSGGGTGSGQPAPINLTVGVKKIGGGRSLTTKSTDIKTIALAICSTALVVVLGFIAYQKFVIPPPPAAPITLGQKSNINSTLNKSAQQIPVNSSEVKAGETTSTSNKLVASADSNSVDKTKENESVKKISVEKPKVQRTKRSSSRTKSQKTKRDRPRSSSKARSTRSTSSKRSKRSEKPKKSEANALLSNLKGGRKSKGSGGSDLSAITGGSKPKKSGPKKPSKKSIVSAMRKVNLNGCLGREPGLKGKGKIKVRIVAVSSGAIKTAQVLNSPFKSSPVGACLEREVRRQRFPSFTDPDISFTFPFKN